MPAGQPEIAVLQADPVADVYETVLDYTGKGAFSVINFFRSGGNIDQYTLKLTVDGGAALEKRLGLAEFHKSVVLDYTGATDKRVTLDFGLIAFATSLKIEVKHNAVGRIIVSCLYQTHA